MKRLATRACLFSVLKHHTKLLIPGGIAQYTAKLKVKVKLTDKRRLKCHEICHFKIVGLLAGCFGIWGLDKRREHESFEQLAAETVFSIKEVEALYELFKKLSNSVVGDGVIHKENFRLALFRNSKQENFFADRVFTVFDAKKCGVIAFGEFVRTLGIFHPDTSREEKIDFAFKLYDLRQTGLIEREEVEKMVIALLSESDVYISSEVISAIVDKTFAEVDLKGDGKIDKEEWKAFVNEHPSLMKIMTLPYLKTVSRPFPSFIATAEVEDNTSG